MAISAGVKSVNDASTDPPRMRRYASATARMVTATTATLYNARYTGYAFFGCIADCATAPATASVSP
jgi:hypothetical protein